LRNKKKAQHFCWAFFILIESIQEPAAQSIEHKVQRIKLVSPVSLRLKA
jgi:hypothetical protein